MNAIRQATDQQPEVIMMTRDPRKQIVGERTLHRNICTGKLSWEYTDKVSHLDKQVIVFITEHGRNLCVDDLMIVNQMLSTDYPYFYLDNADSCTDHHLKGKVKPNAPFHWDFCHKVIACSDTELRQKYTLETITMDFMEEAFPEQLYITEEMVTQAGFTVTEDNGQYVKAKEKKSKVNVLRELAMNREGSYLAIKTDGGTRTTFSGRIETAEEFFTIMKCAY